MKRSRIRPTVGLVRLGLLAGTLLALAAGPLRAQLTAPGDVAIEDVLELLLLDGDLVAVDATGGGQLTAPLELNETVRWYGSRGKVGVALTDRRILAVGTGSGTWQTTRYRRTETPPERAFLGDRVALLLTGQRAIGFADRNLIEQDLGLREETLAFRVGQNVAVVVTNRRALGLSPFAGGFFAIPMELRERIESVEARSNIATVTTQHRLLIFRANTGSWEVRRREIHRR